MMDNKSDQSPSASPADPSRDKSPLYLGLAAAIVALCGIALSLIFEGRILRGVTIIAAVIFWIVIDTLLKKRDQAEPRETDSD